MLTGVKIFLNKIVEEYETYFISNMLFWWSYSSQTK